MGILDEPPELRSGLLAEIADWWNRGGLAGSLGMEPADRQIAEHSRRAAEMRASGVGLLDQLLAGRDNPMLGMMGPENLAGKLGAALMFAGKGAKTADLLAKSTAEKMAKAGASRDEIWNKTGWFQGPDQQWRFEIDDSGAKIGDKARAELTAGGDHGATQRTAAGTLWHKELYDAYPDLRRADVDARFNAELQNSKGSWQPDTDNLYGNRSQVNIQANQIDGPQGVKGIALHEFQHGIQDADGLAQGGSPGKGERAPFVYDGPQIADLRSKITALEDQYEALIKAGAKYDDPRFDSLRREMSLLESRMDPIAAMEGYRRLAGEAEARNVQTRMNMTPEQRRATPPWLTLDVPEDQLIVRGLLD